MQEQRLGDEQIRAELNQVLASTLFSASGRLRSLLAYIVGEILAGRGEQVKESTIGVAVYGKAADYDPKTDATVRGDALRLRARLREYYDTEGQYNSVRIEVPKGRYVPVFHIREKPMPTGTPAQRAPLERHWKTATLALLIALAGSAGTYVAMRAWTPQTSEPKFIAVLPIQNRTQDPENEALCDGFTQALIDSLTRVGGLRVIAWNSVSRLKQTPYELRYLKRELGAELALQGEMRTSGGLREISVRLIDVTQQSQLWSQDYRDDNSDLPTIRREIGAAVTAHYASRRRSSDDAEVPQKASTRGVEEAYLLSLGLMAQSSREALEKAHALLQNAVAEDPDFAPAYSALGLSYYLLGPQLGVLPREEGARQAKQALHQSIRLDETLADAHVNLGRILTDLDWDFSGAEREFKRAIELNPGSEKVHRRYAQFLAKMGRFDESLEHFDICIKVDPLSSTRTAKAEALVRAERYDEAVQLCRTNLDLHPHDWPTHAILAQAHIGQGRFSAGVDALLRAESLGQRDSTYLLAELAYAHAISGNRSRAEFLLDKLLSRSRHEYVRPFLLALVYVGFGQSSMALDQIEKGYSVRDTQLPAIKSDSRFRALKYEPRFVNVLRKMGLG